MYVVFRIFSVGEVALNVVLRLPYSGVFIAVRFVLHLVESICPCFHSLRLVGVYTSEAKDLVELKS